jgi:hypothetical protein
MATVMLKMELRERKGGVIGFGTMEKIKHWGRWVCEGTDGRRERMKGRSSWT